MKDRRNAVLWAIGWWLFRRQLRRRAALAVGDVAHRSRLRAVLGAVVLVGLLAAALVAARKLLSGPDEIEAPPLPDVPIEPVPETAPA
jgi:hypothetical protein